jgi:hypothetical protein
MMLCTAVHNSDYKLILVTYTVSIFRFRVDYYGDWYDAIYCVEDDSFQGQRRAVSLK